MIDSELLGIYGLEDCDTVGRTSYASGDLPSLVSNPHRPGEWIIDLQWHASKEEGPPTALATFLAEALQVEQPADWNAPACEQPLVQDKFPILTWICLETRHVPSYRRKIAVPDSWQDFTPMTGGAAYSASRLHSAGERFS